jgi:cytochrome c biogenesis protein CcmG, thiol:disulfide interchange protein DsbE
MRAPLPTDSPTWLRVLAAVVPAAAFIALLGFGLRGADGPPAPGDPAPDFEAAPLVNAEDPVSLSDFRGRPVLVNFWASWCEPCVDEAPMLRQAHSEFGDDVAFVGVDIRDSRADALRFVDRHQLDYVHVRDEQLEIYRDYGLTGQPESFLIDAEGRVVDHAQGPFPSKRDLFALLEDLVSRG